jgi:GNAT superfamily N-acetyltransferase
MAENYAPRSWFIQPLGSAHDRAAFSCGHHALDRYLKTQARQDIRRNIAAPFVLINAADETTIIGYYTLSAFGVGLEDLPTEIAKKLPNYPIVPATLLGRLAVDRRAAGQGFGEILLMDALHRAWRQSAGIAAAAVVVDAIDQDAANFYRHFDFLEFTDCADRFFLPMKSIAAMFRDK